MQKVKRLEQIFNDKNTNKILFSNYQNSEILTKVPINSIEIMDEITKKQILEKIENYGFSILQIKNIVMSSNAVLSLSQSLKLGQPFIPPYYKSFSESIKVHSGINTIGKTGEGSDNQGLIHNAFGTSEGQKLHVDGTVQKIGKIKTSMVACHVRAMQGGLSTFFNASAVFYKLFERDQEAALALMEQQALSRAVDTDKDNPYTDAVIAIEGDHIISRFSLDNTSNWEDGFKRIKPLKRAYDFFVDNIYEGSPFYREIQLNEGEVVIMSNARISHGRTSYISYPHSERKMYRALYEQDPS